MELEGKISILIGRDFTIIEIEDDQANTTFARITLTPEQLSAALSRQACVGCKLEVNGLNKIGKKHENKNFEFEIPKELSTSSKSKELRIIAQSKLNGGNGWIADSYFGSQDSFFIKENKNYARCTIRRWI